MMTRLLHRENPPTDLHKAERDAARAEFTWLLESILPHTTNTLISGLQECVAILASESSITLALSSARSEHLKGFIVRRGDEIVKTDIRLKMPTFNSGRGYNLTLTPRGIGQHGEVQSEPHPIPLPQYSAAKRMISRALELASSSDFLSPEKASSNLSTLAELLHTTLTTLRSPDNHTLFPYAALSTDILPSSLSLDIFLADGAVTLDLRSLRLSPNPSDFTHKQHWAMGFGKVKHEPQGEVYRYAEQYAKVLEKVRVESQDPGLMAVMVKVSVLEGAARQAREKVEIAGWVMRENNQLL
ncbi:hypothetical protein YB2330_005746 [Saitoella coloradoensis]